MFTLFTFVKEWTRCTDMATNKKQPYTSVPNVGKGILKRLKSVLHSLRCPVLLDTLHICRLIRYIDSLHNQTPVLQTQLYQISEQLLSATKSSLTANHINPIKVKL